MLIIWKQFQRISQDSVLEDSLFEQKEYGPLVTVTFLMYVLYIQLPPPSVGILINN